MKPQALSWMKGRPLKTDSLYNQEAMKYEYKENFLFGCMRAKHIKNTRVDYRGAVRESGCALHSLHQSLTHANEVTEL